ncbi:MAG: protease [Chloroflexi bacterium]|nr:MAG: protease [Chloroflexota bacterium]
MKLLQRSVLVLVAVVLGFSAVLFYQRVSQMPTGSPRLQEVPPSPTPTHTAIAEPVPTEEAPPPPTPEPVSTAEPLSPEAEIALNFIAEQEDIPREELVVTGEEAKAFPLLERSYVLVSLLHNRAEALRTFRLLVDPATKAVEPDVESVVVAEHEAYQARYGKFDPPLYDRLQIASEEEQIPVIIWAAESGEEDSVKIAEAEVAQLYPEAARALAERGVAWSVEDEALRLEIKQKYAEILAELAASRVDPVMEWLEAKGYEVERIDGSPMVAATVSKQDILELAELEAVGSILLGGGQAAPSSNISTPTSRVPVVWSRGMNGGNVRLAIVEQGKINNTARNCLNVIETRDSSVGDWPHKSRVAAITACNNATLPGVAQGAQIMDAGYPISGTDVDAANALTWAVDVKLADVTNHSERILAPQTDTNLYYLDKFYDYKVRNFKFTAVVAAGNRDVTDNVGTPAKGWNVIAVGNAEDQDTAAWWDDKINETAIGSSYINPNTGVEKPEVAAPGTNINTVAGQGTRTSYAAPQVAGLAALLMQRNSDLKDMPMAVKAILMASAVHNLENSKRLSDLDGAGGVDAALADWIAQSVGGTNACIVPCWWDIPINDSNLPEPGPPPQATNYLYRTFTASQGERIRVVISWFSAASADGVQDNLRTELNLHVQRPNGTVVQSSTSSANGFEIVDFTADATGTFTIAVERLYLGAYNESGNTLGIAWMKLATYLPEVRRASDGWTSTIYVRNDGHTNWQGKVTFFNQSGAYAGDHSATLAPNAVWSGATPPNNWIGTAIVEGSDDISVVIRNDKTGLATLDNGLSAGGATDPAWGQAGTVLYAPALYNNIFGGYNSTIYIQNPNATLTTLAPYLYGRTGYNDYPQGNIYMGDGNQQVLPLGPMVNNTSWVGSFYGTADRPLALRIFESKGSGESRSYNASAGGRWLVYVPVAYKNAFGFITGLVIQNLHASSSTNVTLRFCERTVTNPATCPTHSISNVGARRSVGLNLNDAPVANGWTGSISIQSSSSSFPLAVAVTNANSVGGYNVSATGYGSKLVILPRAARNASGRTTGYTVRNVSGLNNVSVTARYYSSDGMYVNQRTFTLHSAQTDGYFQSNDAFLADGWQGSIVIEATADVVAIMREDTSTTTSAYNGVSR